MKAFIVGHSNYIFGDRETFVPLPPPNGKGVTVHFHADHGARLSGSAALAVVQSSAAAGSIETYDAGDSIPNYYFGQADDEDVALYMAYPPSEGQIYFVGFDLPATCALCTDFGAGRCTVETGHHCDGLFTLLSHVDELHLVVCRSAQNDKDPPLHVAIGKGRDTELDDEIVRVYNEILDLAEDDPRAAGELFDSLPPASQALLLSDNLEFKSWQVLRSAREYLHSTSDVAFYRYYTHLPPDRKMIIDTDPDLVRVANWCADLVARFAVDDDQARAALWEALEDDMRRDLIAISEVARDWAFQYDDQRSHDLSDVDWTGVARHNAAFLLGMPTGEESLFVQLGDRVLIGDDPSHYAVAGCLNAQPGVFRGRFMLEKPLHDAGGDPAASGTLSVFALEDTTGFQDALVQINATGTFSGVYVVAADHSDSS